MLATGYTPGRDGPSWLCNDDDDDGGSPVLASLAMGHWGMFPSTSHCLIFQVTSEHSTLCGCLFS